MAQYSTLIWREKSTEQYTVLYLKIETLLAQYRTQYCTWLQMATVEDSKQYSTCMWKITVHEKWMMRVEDSKIPEYGG